MFFDADHGKRLTDALDDMVAKNADLVFLEGFTDMAENAAYWRSTDNIYYDFPNQRLNILRKYSSSRARGRIIPCRNGGLRLLLRCIC